MFLFSKQFKFWAWDPEEERRRQEKWQQEQERLLQVRQLGSLPFFFFSDALLISVILNRFPGKRGIEFFSEVSESVSSFCRPNALCLIPHARGYTDEHKEKAFHLKKIIFNFHVLINANSGSPLLLCGQ